MGELRDYINSMTASIVTHLVQSGQFDREIEAIIIDHTRGGPSGPLTKLGFILKMAVYAMDASGGKLSFLEAKRLASSAFASFCKDSRIKKFGEPGWDWSSDGAKQVMHEYEVSYWDPSDA